MSLRASRHAASLPVRVAVNPPTVDKFDAGFYDSPSWKRLGRPDPMREVREPLRINQQCDKYHRTRTLIMSKLDPKPEPPKTIGWQHERYNDRDFYGEHSHDRAELTYLRDLCAWQQRHLGSYESWECSVNEALNTGDGAYRP